MIRHFCDVCDKVLEPNDTSRTSELHWYKLSKVTWTFGGGQIETASAEICNDCLKAIVDEAKKKGKI